MILELKAGEEIKESDRVFFTSDLILKSCSTYKYDPYTAAEVFNSPCDLMPGDIAVFELFNGNSVFLYKMPKGNDENRNQRT